MHNELPTLDKLAIKRPDIYNDFKTCVICQEKEENREHLFQCKGLSVLSDQIWNKTLEEFEKDLYQVLKKTEKTKHTKARFDLSPDCNEASPKLSQQNIKDIAKKISTILNREKIKSPEFLLCFLLGLLDNDLVKKMSKKASKQRTSTTKIRDLLLQTSSKFRERFRKDIWNYRCTKIIEIESIRNITNKTKKRREKKTKLNSNTTRKEKEKERRKGSKEKRRRNPQEKRDIQEKRRIIEAIKTSITEDIKSRVYNWIKQGTKWLGII